ASPGASTRLLTGLLAQELRREALPFADPLRLDGDGVDRLLYLLEACFETLEVRVREGPAAAVVEADPREGDGGAAGRHERERSDLRAAHHLAALLAGSRSLRSLVVKRCPSLIRSASIAMASTLCSSRARRSAISFSSWVSAARGRRANARAIP